MFKKTITYTDYNGTERTEDFYFHLNKAEIIEMEASTDGSYGEMLKRIVAAKDGPTIMKTFKEFILKSYGIKSEDGKHFRKSEEISKDFEQSEAYSELFMEICTNADAASAFITGILPLSDAERKEVMSKAQSQLPSNT